MDDLHLEETVIARDAGENGRRFLRCNAESNRSRCGEYTHCRFEEAWH